MAEVGLYRPVGDSPAIAVQVEHHAIQPVLRLAPGRNRGGDANAVGPAQEVYWKFLVESFLEARAAEMRDRSAKTRDVEPLGRRGQRHGPLGGCINGFHRNVRRARVDEVRVDLVADDRQVVSGGDRRDRFELSPREYTSARVVWAAERSEER